MRVVDASEIPMLALRRIHRASGFDYQFPKEFKKTPLFPLKRAVVNGDARRPLACGAVKVVGEAYLWMDHGYGTPKQRLDALQLLNADLEQRARDLGFDQVHCALPPEIAERFGERIEALGWAPARPWPLYTFQLR